MCHVFDCWTWVVTIKNNCSSPITFQNKGCIWLSNLVTCWTFLPFYFVYKWPTIKDELMIFIFVRRWFRNHAAMLVVLRACSCNAFASCGLFGLRRTVAVSNSDGGKVCNSYFMTSSISTSDRDATTYSLWNSKVWSIVISAVETLTDASEAILLILFYYVVKTKRYLCLSSFQ